MSIRRRLSQEESRTAALEAARSLLIEMGPQAVTLKAVASRIGRTHANLLHHFGSASGLQKSLAQYLAGTICKTIAEAVLASRVGQGTERDIVDLTFDAFDRDENIGSFLHQVCVFSGNEALNSERSEVGDGCQRFAGLSNFARFCVQHRDGAGDGGADQAELGSRLNLFFFI